MEGANAGVGPDRKAPGMRIRGSSIGANKGGEACGKALETFTEGHTIEGANVEGRLDNAPEMSARRSVVVDSASGLACLSDRLPSLYRLS